MTFEIDLIEIEGFAPIAMMTEENTSAYVAALTRRAATEDDSEKRKRIEEALVSVEKNARRARDAATGHIRRVSYDARPYTYGEKLEARDCRVCDQIRARGGGSESFESHAL